MAEMSMKPPDPVAIRINGEEYPVLKSDVEILGMLRALRAKYPDGARLDAEGIYAGGHAMRGMVEALLGEGAVKRISGREQPGFAWLRRLLVEASTCALTAMGEKLEELYE